MIVSGGESGDQEPAHNEVELFDPQTKVEIITADERRQTWDAGDYS